MRLAREKAIIAAYWPVGLHAILAGAALPETRRDHRPSVRATSACRFCPEWRDCACHPAAGHSRQGFLFQIPAAMLGPPAFRDGLVPDGRPLHVGDGSHVPVADTARTLPPSPITKGCSCWLLGPRDRPMTVVGVRALSISSHEGRVALIGFLGDLPAHLFAGQPVVSGFGGRVARGLRWTRRFVLATLTT